MKTRLPLKSIFYSTKRLNEKVFLLSSILLLGLSSCKKDTTWNSDWVVPLINDNLNLSKLVNDSTLQEQSGVYVLDFKRNLYDFALTDIVGIPDTTINRNTSLSIQSITAPPGFEFFNSIEEHALNLQDLELKIIHLNGGRIEFELANPLSSGIYLTIELPGVTKNNAVLSETFFLPAGSIANPSTVKQIISLVGFQIDLRGTQGTSFNRLQSRVKIKTDPNGANVPVTNLHSFKVGARFLDVKLKYARGYFGQRVLAETKDFTLDALNAVVGGMIDLPNTSIKLTLENGIKVSGNGMIDYLKNTNASGTSVALSGLGNQFSIDEPTGSFGSMVPSKHVFLFNSTNSNIEQFIENLGAKNEVKFKLQINPWGNTSGGWNEVYEQSRLRFSMEAQMPLAIKMDALKVRDTFAFELKQNRDKSHIGSGILQLDIDNGFPFQANIKIQFLDENKQLVATTNSSQAIMSSVYGQLNIEGVQHMQSKVEIPLDANLSEQLAKVKHLVAEVVFDTPQAVNASNAQVAIPVNAFIKIKALARFKLSMKV